MLGDNAERIKNTLGHKICLPIIISPTYSQVTRPPFTLFPNSHRPTINTNSPVPDSRYMPVSPRSTHEFSCPNSRLQTPDPRLPSVNNPLPCPDTIHQRHISFSLTTYHFHTDHGPWSITDPDVRRTIHKVFTNNRPLRLVTLALTTGLDVRRRAA